MRSRSAGPGANAYLYNNIGYQAWGANVTSNVRTFVADGGAIMSGADYNLAYTPDNTPTYNWTAQAHARSNRHSLFVNHANDDFTLGATSGARAVAR